MYKFKEGFYSDVRIEKRYTTNIRYRNGALEECKNSAVKKAFIRVFDGDMWYYTSTYKLDDVQGELDKLYASAVPDKDIENNETVKKYQVNRATVERYADCRVTDVAIGEKQKILEDKIKLFVGSKYAKMHQQIYVDRYSAYEFYSSKGASIKYDFQVCGIVLIAFFAEGGENFGNNFMKSGVSFGELTVSDEEVKEFIAESENFLLHAKPVTAGEYPVILSPVAAGVFAHESFGHKSEADFMIGDETMKKEWAIGSKVGSEILSIYDSGLDAGSGYVPFDDEGTRATKTYLIKNGKLSGRLHSASTAVDLGEELTGNARAVNCDFEPIVRMTTTVIEAGTSKKEELFTKIKHGYFIKNISHGSGMSTFTIAPTLSYEIVDGKIGDPVKIAVITGNVFKTLDLIDGLSDKAELLSFITGGCGKMEQYPLNVGFGGPYVSISKMNVQ